MINSFEIQNFRNLDGLKIKSFGKVNLISGKNNTGKTNLLQALELFASDFNLEVLRRQLKSKRELNIINSIKNSNSNILNNIEIFSNIFTNRIHENYNKTIVLSDNLESIKCKIQNKENDLGLSVNKKSVNKKSESKIFLFNHETIGIHSHIKLDPITNIDFIETTEIEKDKNIYLWDNISLSDNEKYIIEALNIIDPNIEKLVFKGRTDDEIYPIIKIKNQNKPIPLKSMGDGINRILTIILSMVNCENGYLFIDEFENGLHYSVQENLWKMIFMLAETLNIQVFVTTHNNDCINAFQKVLNDPKNTISGQYIRLDNKNGQIKEVVYTKDEINFALENNIETR